MLESAYSVKYGKMIRIDDKEYRTEIVYDMPNSIGIIGEGDFVGKEIIL